MNRYVLIHDETGYGICLAHHGIKGQKWGIRRFQNPDMTWTDAGKIRYGNSNGKSANTDSSETDRHQKSGSTKDEVASLLLNTAISAVTLNPIGAASSLYRVGQVVSANAKEKSAAKRLRNAEIDEKTGLPLKAKETTADQDVKMVNPGFKNLNNNTKNNCVLCSTAFELRRRSFDVVAGKASVGYNADEYTKWFIGAKQESKGGFTPDSVFSLPNREKSKELFSWANEKLLSQGNGARGYLSIAMGPGAGHSMAYEVQGDKVVVYDAQCGKKKSLQSVTNISVDIGFTRLDNLQPDIAQMRKDGVFI